MPLPRLLPLLLPPLHMVGRALYRVLSPDMCTTLARLPLARAMVGALIPDGLTEFRCRHGIRLKLRREEAILTGVFHTGCINPIETGLMLKHLRPGDTFIDCGTYVDGWHSILASKIVGPQGRVVSFEPIPEHYSRFSENLALNCCANVTAEPFAVSDSAGEVEFVEDASGSSFVAGETITGPRHKVRTIALDAYAAEHGIERMDFLKIDVEGAEMLALKGAERQLAKNVRFILIEVADESLGRTGNAPPDLIRFLGGFDLLPYIITRAGPQPWEPGLKSETLNMLFARRGLLG